MMPSANIDRQRGTYHFSNLESLWPATGKLRNGEAYSVTHVLNILDKPFIKTWAAKVERDLVLKSVREEAFYFAFVSTKTPQVFADRYGNGGNNDSAHDSFADRFVELVEQRVGKRYAYDVSNMRSVDTGNEVHHEIERRIRSGKLFEPSGVPLSRHGELCIAAFEKWAKETSFEPIETEIQMCNVQDRYAGTIDCIARVNGKLAIIDWKTSNYFRPEMKLQLAAYAAGRDSDVGLIVRFPKNGGRKGKSFEVLSLSDKELDIYYHKFCAILAAFRAMENA